MINLERARKRTLLVVEDNDLNRELLASLLEDEYVILQAENGKVGIDLLQDNIDRISLILLDIQMPVMNGYEFLEKLHENPKLESIPVIVTTANQDMEEEIKCLELGASDFVTKPYIPEIIKSRVNSIIRLKESSTALLNIEVDDITGLYTRQAFFHYAEELLRMDDSRYDLLITSFENYESLSIEYEKQAKDLLSTYTKYLKENYANKMLVGHYIDDQMVFFIKNADTKTYQDMIEDLEVACKLKDVHGVQLKFGIYQNVERNLRITQICDCALLVLKDIENDFSKQIGYFDEEYIEKQKRYRFITFNMEESLKEEHFKVYFQPKHNPKNGKLIGAEALVRWIHPTAGFMNPGEFVPLFEKNGFVTKLDSFMWNKVCQYQRKWKDMGISVVPVSVNASKIDLNNDEYVNQIVQSIQDNDLPFDCMHLEITETLFSDFSSNLTNVLQQYRKKGIQIELDDFGSGYSSLNALSSLPIDVVKLDMSFMKNIKDSKKANVLLGCINLCKSLNLKTVQEGVETEEQLHLLQIMGVDAIQGYYYSKPIPASEFEEYLKKYR